MDAYMAAQIEALIAALERCEDGRVRLISDLKEEQLLIPGLLRLIPPSWAHSGDFFVFDSHLSKFKEYDQGTMWIPKACYPEISKAWSSSRGGRPNLAARDWYFERNCNRGGLSLNELQRKMEAETGHAPSQGAIRHWEKEYRSKLQTIHNT